MGNNLSSMSAASVFGSYAGPVVIVKFAGRDEYASFPARSVSFLAEDPATMEIIDAETGELLFYR